jgi:hypothetical protein
MSDLTLIQFVWKGGRPFTQLSKLVFDHYNQAGLPFRRLSVPNKNGSGRFMIMRYECQPPFEFPHGPWEDVPYPNEVTRLLDYTDTPWEDDPWLKPGTGTISWSVLENHGDGVGRSWADFYVRIEESLRYFSESMPTKVYHMLMAIDGSLADPYEANAEEFELLCRKYDDIKDLYRILDCDEAFVQNPGRHDLETARRWFPHYRYMDLRLAKEGTQVLVKRMEERRREPALPWLHSRIFIDPPGVNALSPEEYEKMAAK